MQLMRIADDRAGWSPNRPDHIDTVRRADLNEFGATIDFLSSVLRVSDGPIKWPKCPEQRASRVQTATLASHFKRDAR